MTDSNNIKFNIFITTGLQIANVIAPLITTPYVSRVLGAEKIGIYSFTSSIQTYFLLLASLGTISYGTREISMNRSDTYNRSKLFWEIELLSVFTTILSVIVWMCMILLNNEYKLYYSILSLGIIASMFDISWFFAGIERFAINVIGNVCIKLLGVICIFMLIKDRNDLYLYVLILSLSAVLTNAFAWLFVKKYITKVPLKDLRFKKHFKETIIYFIPTIATSVYTVLDRTLIGIITHDMSENGYYQSAEKVISVAKNLVFTALNSVVGVRVSYLFKQHKEDEIKKTIEKSLSYIFFMGFGSCFGILGVSKTFVPLFFGPGYERVITLLNVFGPIIVVIGVSNCLGSQYYTPCGKRAQSAMYIVWGAVTNLLLNIIFIPKWGAVGAAIASLAAELMITGLYVINSNDYANFLLVVKVGWKKLLAGGIMLGAIELVYFLQLSALRLFMLQVIIGIFVYCIALMLINDPLALHYKNVLMSKIRTKKN